MEIGDYYRTKRGGIYKIKTMNTPETRREKHIGYVKRNIHLVNGRHTLEDIKIHSPNKIDLVEKGDYVNGELVIDIDRYYDEDGKYCGCRVLTQYRISQFSGLDKRYYLYETDIKSIVTREQFASQEYKF